MIYVIITLPHATVCWSELNNFVYIFNLAHTSHFIVQIGWETKIYMYRFPARIHDVFAQVLLAISYLALYEIYMYIANSMPI